MTDEHAYFNVNLMVWASNTCFLPAKFLLLMTLHCLA